MALFAGFNVLVIKETNFRDTIDVTIDYVCELLVSKSFIDCLANVVKVAEDISFIL